MKLPLLFRLRFRLTGSAALYTLAVLLLLGPASAGTAATLVIRNGTVVDGSGSPGRVADVWIRDGTIAAIGDAPGMHADREIDAAGKIVAPGFIDTHAHGNPERTPEFENFLRMGVTTLCLGQDGGSAFGEDLARWRDEIEASGVAPNIAPFAGHGSIRRQSGVGIDPNPSKDDIARMVALVEKAMDAGAFGMTTGLEYQPGTFASIDELAAVARPVATRGGVVMSHVRNEDNGAVLESVAELIEQGRRSGARVHVSHIKTVYGRGSETAENLLAVLNQGRASGVEITADLYPYIASYTGIGILFPDWAKPPHDYDRVVREKRGELADYLRDRVNRRNGPDATLIGTGVWRGKTLAEISSETEKPFEEVLIDMGPGGASGAYFVMDAAVMERYLVDPYVMICTDGSPGMLHPRAYGSFAKILARYVRDEERLDLEEAIRKMSGLPSATIGLDRADLERGILPRGKLKVGWAADLVIFSITNVNDRATFEEPNLLSQGFEYVFVNGEPVIERGEMRYVRPGKVLRFAGR